MSRKPVAKSLIVFVLGLSVLVGAPLQNPSGSAKPRQSSGAFAYISPTLPGKSRTQEPTPKSAQKQETHKQPTNSNEPNSLHTKTVTSPVDKKEQAMSLLDGTLYSTKQISPVEYRILVEVKAATLFWQFDRERSTTVLKGAVATMRKIKEDEQHSSLSQQSIDKSTEDSGSWCCARSQL